MSTRIELDNFTLTQLLGSFGSLFWCLNHFEALSVQPETVHQFLALVFMEVQEASRRLLLPQGAKYHHARRRVVKLQRPVQRKGEHIAHCTLH